MADVKSIFLAGVGGQGTILASKILTQGLLSNGFDVKMSEIHGMSQRGGSVSAQVRYGRKVYSPIISEGEADILVSFEEMETYRWLRFLKPQGKVILNDYRLLSAPILSGQSDYPEGLKEEIRQKTDAVIINAADIALQMGVPKAMNIIMLGASIKAVGLDSIDWARMISENVRPQFLDSSLAALRKGMTLFGTVQ
ncbi:indolepyruvate oxidoreductase subunit beta|uniref:Indolepyruvate ferredoxin oxidoreductase beta subunit n=1 Tax=Dendrosporobacter quercicolus TaxID=146817 RepID=A0A1G9QKC2_9FIRM|nr:indolepyruvate oxidoreductase subunit beta [Dendrosporobacter quercicolus]NSL48275.1 indolepyruvate oxidoreductase subunit beta [Dendrosporobacter quercicolus DSM 1736]SDM11473.1 indolepyruvate ferredoxin oxidoreductase beta subunit [Dendrosporobacter quercicolus]